MPLHALHHRRHHLALLAAAVAVVLAGIGGVLVFGGGSTDVAAAASDDATTTTAVRRQLPRPTTTTASTVPATTAATTPPTTAPTTTTAPQPPPAIAPVVAGERIVVAGEPAALVDQIVQVERIIRDPASPPEWITAAGRLQQLAYRMLGAHPEWDPTVFAALPADLQEAASRQVQARREFRSMHTTLSDHLPAWRIVDPLPADELLALYQEAEAAFGVPWHVLAAVNLVETGMGRIIGLSTAGAQGPMQFMPGTWERYGMGGDVWNPRDAIMGAANYLAANGGNQGTEDGLNNALFRYNNDNRYVRAVRHYSAIMAADPLTYRGFHAWQIVFLSVAGDIVIPVGYDSPERIPVADWLAANPQ